MKTRNTKMLEQIDAVKDRNAKRVDAAQTERNKSFNMKKNTLIPSLQDFKEDAMDQLNQDLKDVC